MSHYYVSQGISYVFVNTSCNDIHIPSSTVTSYHVTMFQDGCLIKGYPWMIWVVINTLTLLYTVLCLHGIKGVNEYLDWGLNKINSPVIPG